jgi:hypothetical protein
MIKNKLLILGLGLLTSTNIFAATEYKGGFCRVARAASSDNKDSSNLSWLKLECFNKDGKPAQGKTGLKKMNVPARWVDGSGNQLKRTFPSYLIIDNQKVPNDGPDALDYFDTISGYGKTIENCKNKFPNLSCKNISFLLQPDHNIFEEATFQSSDKNIPKSCKERPSGWISGAFFNCVEKANDQFSGEDFIQDCQTQFCGRKGVAIKPPAIPTQTEIAAESVKWRSTQEVQTVAKIDETVKSCSADQTKYAELKNKLPRCLSGFHSNQQNARSMYETIAHYMSCSEFDFSSAEVIQEGKHMAAVARNPAAENDCPIKLNIDVDANVGYGKIIFKNISGKITSVDWDSKFDTSNSANNQPYWKSDFGRRLLSTLKSGSSSGGATSSSASGNGNNK